MDESVFAVLHRRQTGAAPYSGQFSAFLDPDDRRRLVDAERNGLPAGEALKAEFEVAHPQYPLDGAFVQFAGQRERRP
jgi:hypothetical protein